jgi:hypothetical protein
MRAGDKAAGRRSNAGPAEEPPKEFVVNPSEIVTHPPDSQEDPPTRVRDRWLSIVLLAEIAGAAGIGSTVVRETLAIAHPGVAVLAFAGVIGTAALLVITLASWCLIRGVRIR